MDVSEETAGPAAAVEGRRPRRPRATVLLVVGIVALLAGGAAAAAFVLLRSPAEAIYEGESFGFSYPASWDVLPEAAFRSTLGSPLSQAVVGLDERNLAFVAAYQTNVPLDESNLEDFREEIAETIGTLVEGAGGTVRSGPARTTMGGFPGYEFGITSRTVDGEPVEGRIVVVFRGTLEYFLNCRSVPGDPEGIAEGCDRIVQTFTVRATDV